MIQAVGFDLDGTLFDDEQYVRGGLDAAADTIEKRHDIDLRDELHEVYFDRDIRERTFDVVVEEHDLSADLVPDLIKAYHDNDAPLTPYSETTDVLEQLRERYSTGLLTGGTNGSAKLERLGIAQYFDAVVVAPDLGLSKYQREPFEMLLDRLDTDPEDAVYVGDRPELDFVYPNRLGMQTIQLQSDRYPVPSADREESPDYVIQNLTELSAILDAVE